MLKNLRLKNWRSLRDVNIDFHPEITVLIGANSSGKTNIIDALYFIRDSFDENFMQAVYNRDGGTKIHSFTTPLSEPVSIEYQIDIPNFKTIKYLENLLFSDNRFLFHIKRTISDANKILLDPKKYTPQPPPDFEGVETGWGDEFAHKDEDMSKISKAVREAITQRWQLLDENFMPYLVTGTSNIGDIYRIDPCADNVVFMLDFMQNTKPDLYNELQDDFRYLLGHVKKVEAVRDEREARIKINETSHPDREAPTISAGTARILAVLTAVYALDMRLSDMPGLVVVEEPETSLNPSLLKNFVEMLRGYARDKKRQFILTTHNPAFLNHFKPEEVRVVSRDENGDSIVNPVPDYIDDIWLKDNDEDYQLGDVWLTNAFGGVAE